MQQSLHRYAKEKTAAARQQAGTGGGSLQPAEQQQAKRRGGSLLMAALSSQLVRGAGTGGGGSGGAGTGGGGSGGAGTGGGGSGGAAAGPAPPLASITFVQPPEQQEQQQQQRGLPLSGRPHPNVPDPGAPTAPALAACGPPRQQQQQQQQPPPHERQPCPAQVPQHITAADAGSGASAMQACPLCGLMLPQGQLLQQHVEDELLLLEEQEQSQERVEQRGADRQAASWEQQAQEGHQLEQRQQAAAARQGHAEQPADGLRQQPWQRAQQQAGGAPQQLPWQPAQQQQQLGQQRPGAAAVLVLGGAPVVTAPTDRRRLAQLHRQRLLPAKRRPVASAYNFFDDGSGALGGEDIGLDGGDGGLKWEGMGTSDF